MDSFDSSPQVTAHFTEDFSLNSAISHLMGLSSALSVSVLSALVVVVEEGSGPQGLGSGTEQHHDVTLSVQLCHPKGAFFPWSQPSFVAGGF